jgi:hypothetical protein
MSRVRELLSVSSLAGEFRRGLSRRRVCGASQRLSRNDKKLDNKLENANILINIELTRSKEQ